MNRKHTMTFAGIFAGAAAMTVAAVPAMAQDAEQPSASIVRVWTSGDENGAWFANADDQDGHSHSESHQIEVKVENGEVTVVIDGEEIPATRIEQDGRRIIIRDEDGKEIRSFGLGLGDRDWRFGFEGQGPSFRWNNADIFDGRQNMPFGMFGQAADPPPVMLGLTMSEPGAALRYHLGLEEGEATLITGVYEGLPAHDAGLREHDIIVSIGDDPANPGAIRERLHEMEDNDRLRLTVISRGERKDVTLRVAEYDAEAMREAEYLGSGQPSPFGFGYRVMPGGDTESFRDIFVAPNADVFRAPREFKFDTSEMQKSIQDAMRKFHEQQQGRGRFDFRLDDEAGEGDGDDASSLDDRMSELERMLDRLLERLDEELKDK